MGFVLFCCIGMMGFIGGILCFALMVASAADDVVEENISE